MYKNWIARYYKGTSNKTICTEKFYNRTESEAEREAIGLMPKGCEDWSLIPLIVKCMVSGGFKTTNLSN